MAQTIARDPVPQLQQITAPTLLLRGEQDALIPITNAQDYLRALSNAKRQTRTIAGCRACAAGRGPGHIACAANRIFEYPAAAAATTAHISGSCSNGGSIPAFGFH